MGIVLLLILLVLFLLYAIFNERARAIRRLRRDKWFNTPPCLYQNTDVKPAKKQE